MTIICSASTCLAALLDTAHQLADLACCWHQLSYKGTMGVALRNASQYLVLFGALLDAIKARDALQIKSVYYPMMEKLLKNATGASRVHIFDHTLRKGTIKEAK